MRKPNHIVLDFETNASRNASQYWAIDYLSSSNQPQFMHELNIQRKYQTNTQLSNKHLNSPLASKYTLSTNVTHKASLLKDWEKNGLTKMFQPLTTASEKSKKHLLQYSQSFGRDAYMYVNLDEDKYHQRNLKCLLIKYASHSSTNLNNSLNTWFNSLNINFLRKERLYTKLKYSRSPAYDIVSGGAAALLAGFFGFLISEKFGYELVDSGDFYYLFMYIVFLSFSVRPLLLVSDASKGFWHTLSLKRVTSFYVELLRVLLYWFKR